MSFDIGVREYEQYRKVKLIEVFHNSFSFLKVSVPAGLSYIYPIFYFESYASWNKLNIPKPSHLFNILATDCK